MTIHFSQGPGGFPGGGLNDQPHPTGPNGHLPGVVGVPPSLNDQPGTDGAPSSKSHQLPSNCVYISRVSQIIFVLFLAQPSGNCNCKADNSCPAGPAGPKGEPGYNGPDGIPGVPGFDGQDAEDAKAQTQQYAGCFTCPQGPAGPPGKIDWVVAPT